MENVASGTFRNLDLQARIFENALSIHSSSATPNNAAGHAVITCLTARHGTVLNLLQINPPKTEAGGQYVLC
jgi:hypothetical protein